MAVRTVRVFRHGREMGTRVVEVTPGNKASMQEVCQMLAAKWRCSTTDVSIQFGRQDGWLEYQGN